MQGAGAVAVLLVFRTLGAQRPVGLFLQSRGVAASIKGLLPLSASPLPSGPLGLRLHFRKRKRSARGLFTMGGGGGERVNLRGGLVGTPTLFSEINPKWGWGLWLLEEPHNFCNFLHGAV